MSQSFSKRRGRGELSPACSTTKGTCVPLGTFSPPASGDRGVAVKEGGRVGLKSGARDVHGVATRGGSWIRYERDREREGRGVCGVRARALKTCRDQCIPKPSKGGAVVPQREQITPLTPPLFSVDL